SPPSSCCSCSRPSRCSRKPRNACSASARSAAPPRAGCAAASSSGWRTRSSASRSVRRSASASAACTSRRDISRRTAPRLPNGRPTLEAVVRARGTALAATGGAAEQAAPENVFIDALKQVLALREAYPALKANEHFLDLQRQLTVTEDRIQAARRFYNANVRD